MKAYIRQNRKTIISVTLILISTVLFICSNELIAKRMPNISELQVTACNVEDSVLEYTGEPLEPAISSIEFVDAEGNEIVKSQDGIVVENYINNTEIGYADVEVSVSGYQGTLVIEDVFEIQLAQVKNLQVVENTRESIELTWDSVTGAEGYIVYRSTDEGATFSQLADISGADMKTYRDSQDIQVNSVYNYKVSAYCEGGETLSGSDSEIVRQVTPLAVPVLVNVNNQAYNTIQLQWEMVDGAVSYQVYRCLTSDGEYECIGEIADGSVTSYADETCVVGVEYFYYIKACQALENENVYGDASNILSVKTTPNQVHVSGNTFNDGTSVTLSWSQSAGSQGYEIFRSAGSESNYQLVQTIGDCATVTWSDSGLDKGTVYYYKLRPYCSVEGTTITGLYSNTYKKEAVVEVNYSYGAGSGNLGSVTQYTGTSYVSGGTSPSGWDCSGFTQWALKNYYGVSIPKSAAAQGSGGASVNVNDRSSWQPGDILAYQTNGKITHVALYIGNGQIMHALNENYDTIIQGVDYYEKWDSGNSLAAVKRYY